jgi:uncharacterized protein YjiS (DUF1127 family)
MTAIPFPTPNRAAHQVSLGQRHGRVREFAQSALAALRDWRRRVRNRRELMALDDRTLHDLGLSRSEISYLVSRAAESPPFPPL